MLKEKIALKNIKLGLIPAPDLPAQLTSKIVDDLPHLLQKHIDQTVTFKTEIVIDPLVGTAEYMNQLMDKIIHLKYENDWHYVICLTDLPHLSGKSVVIADVNQKNHVAMISIPAFGAFPLKHRIKRAICEIIQQMYQDNHQEHQILSTQETRISRRAHENNKRKSLIAFLNPVRQIYQNETEQQPSLIPVIESGQEVNKQDTDKEKSNQKDTKTQESTKYKSDIRYIIQSRLRGYLLILTGMAYANRPWSALISLKKVLMFAFGTGIYITLFTTPWELSTIYSFPRFIILMGVAVGGMTTWMIFAHNLWENPSKKGDRRLRKLYNYTTVITLIFIVFTIYFVLFCFFLGAIAIFVPQGLFAENTDLGDYPAFNYYLRLTWLITSLGTLAGSIGTTSENEEKIRDITYSYRQVNRYYAIQDKEDDKQQSESADNESKEVE